MSSAYGPRCRGLFGWLFGHKFIKGAGDYHYRADHCWRCGFKRNAA